MRDWLQRIRRGMIPGFLTCALILDLMAGTAGAAPFLLEAEAEGTRVLNHLYLIYETSGPGGASYTAERLTDHLDYLPAGHEIEVQLQSAYAPVRYTFMGWYDYGRGVMAGMNEQASIATLGKNSWETTFTKPGYGEGTVGNWLRDDNKLALIGFFKDYVSVLGTSVGQESHLINFCIASPGGKGELTATAPTPLPPSILLLVPGLGMLLLRRRFPA